MPYHGLSSFLLEIAKDIIKHNASVSMPYHGLSSFLQDGLSDLDYLEKGFNALPRAFFFSTKLSTVDTRIQYRFNALPRAFFFSTTL